MTGVATPQMLAAGDTGLMRWVYAETDDGLRLPGCLWDPAGGRAGRTLVVFVHGLAGMVVENPSFVQLAARLQAAGYGFLYTHNSGYGALNSIRQYDEFGVFSRKQRMGAGYERFDDCRIDLDAWLGVAAELGYARLVLLGFSLGGTKVLSYLGLHENPVVDVSALVAGVVLMGTGDMPGLFRRDMAGLPLPELLATAGGLLEQGQHEALMPGLPLVAGVPTSVQTFVDLATEHGPADVWPVARNPAADDPAWLAVQRLTWPLLLVYGETDRVLFNGFDDDVAVIRARAVNVARFDARMIAGAGHHYDDQADALAEALLGWLAGLAPEVTA